MRRKNVYEIPLIKVRKSLETVSNILIFSFSIAGRLKFRNNGRFNPSRNLNQSFNYFLFLFQLTYFSTTAKAVCGLTRANWEFGSPYFSI
jgi:hypothetical protein